MRTILCFLFLLGLFSTCTTESDNPETKVLKIELFADLICNNQKTAENQSQTPTSQTCVQYAFDRDNQKLILKHLNAAFNCCLDSLWCTIVLRSDTLIIQEFEKHLGCKCNCLYELNMEISGIEMGNYHLKLIEPYCEEQGKLCFEMDLLSEKQGSWCVVRDQYPWGE